jgi:hypothetical protein
MLFVLQYPVALTLTAPARGFAPVALTVLTLTVVALTLTAPAVALLGMGSPTDPGKRLYLPC